MTLTRYQERDEILHRQIQKYEELTNLTINSTVLGTFWELALREVIEDLISLSEYRDMLIVGTGALRFPQKSRSGQCDLIVYEALPEVKEFFGRNLVVVPPSSVLAIIESKSSISTITSLDADNKERSNTFYYALGQVQKLKREGGASQSLIYLFIQLSNNISPQDLSTAMERWVSSMGNTHLPDGIVLLDQQCVLPIRRIEDGFQIALRQIEEPQSEVPETSTDSSNFDFDFDFDFDSISESTTSPTLESELEEFPSPELYEELNEAEKWAEFMEKMAGIPNDLRRYLEEWRTSLSFFTGWFMRDLMRLVEERMFERRFPNTAQQAHPPDAATPQ